MSMASDRALLFFMVWFAMLGVGLLAYMFDCRGSLSRVVDQRFVIAQQAAFDPSQSDQARRWARVFDRSEIRRQQRLAAGIGVAMCICAVALCAVVLATRVL